MEPKDIIVWILLKDVVALTWLIQRNRRLSESFVRTGRRKGMEHLLQLSLPVEEDKFPDEEE